jgi:hypothetical protein
MLLGGAKREAPAQAELRPTCAGPAMSKRQRIEWVFPRQPVTYFNTYGVNPGLNLPAPFVAVALFLRPVRFVPKSPLTSRETPRGRRH